MTTGMQALGYGRSSDWPETLCRAEIRLTTAEQRVLDATTAAQLEQATNDLRRARQNFGLHMRRRDMVLRPHIYSRRKSAVVT